MPRECTICLGSHVSAINHALRIGGTYATIAARYQVSRHVLRRHQAQCTDLNVPAPMAGLRPETTVATTETRADPGLPFQDMTDALTRLQEIAAPQVAENPLSQFKQAWQRAKDDPVLRASMVAYIQDELREEWA